MRMRDADAACETLPLFVDTTYWIAQALKYATSRVRFPDVVALYRTVLARPQRSKNSSKKCICISEKILSACRINVVADSEEVASI